MAHAAFRSPTPLDNGSGSAPDNGWGNGQRMAVAVRPVAKDALMAGNDVLPVVNFAPASESGWFTGQLPTIKETITFFQDEYRGNELFRQRVDDAVRHILRAKLRLYPELTLDSVLVEEPDISGAGDQVVAELARQALTLLYPQPEDLSRVGAEQLFPRTDSQVGGCHALVAIQQPSLHPMGDRGQILRLYAVFPVDFHEIDPFRKAQPPVDPFGLTVVVPGALNIEKVTCRRTDHGWLRCP